MASDENIDLQKMRDIISSIASEIQQYQNDEDYSDSNENKICVEENQLKYVLRLKYKLKFKNELISKLKQDLSTACIVARTVASAKDRQSESFKNEIKELLEENVKLNETLKSQTGVVSKLMEENNKLNSILNEITDFVNLSYEELPKSDTVLTDCQTLMEKIKLIVLSCGQHYTKASNVQKICSILQRKNRFLTNKMYILESNLQSLTEQLKHQQYLNNKQLKDNDGDNKPIIYKTVVAYSDLKIKEFDGIADSSSSKGYHGKLVNPRDLSQKLDLSQHFTIVKKLMNDQDTLSKDLNVISEDICSFHQPEENNSKSVSR